MILIATGGAYDHPTPSLQRLIEALESKGFVAQHRPWNGTPMEIFAAADVVLPLCCWAYQPVLGSFVAWLDQLAETGTRVLNNPSTILWNLSKAHLLDIAAAGLRLPTTILLPTADKDLICAKMTEMGWTERS